MGERKESTLVVDLARQQQFHARAISLDQNPVIAIHKPGSTAIDLRRLLLQKQDETAVNKLINPEGKWIYRVDRTIDPADTSPRDLFKGFMNDLEPVYNAVSFSLDSLRPYGFNRHDRAHVERVGETGFYLLEQGGYDENTQRLFAAAAASHDLGNLLSRFSQSVLATQIFRDIYPNLKFEQKDWRKIERAVKRHEENIARGLHDSYLKHATPTTLAKRSTDMLNHFRPEGLALIASDKMHVGRERVSVKANDPRAVDSDPHTATNLLLETTSTTVQGDKFSWNLDFNPEVRASELPRFGGLALPHSSRDGYKIYVSQHAHDLYRNEGKPHFKSAVEQFFDIYQERVELTVESIFALLPNVQTFEMGFADRSATNGFTFDTAAKITRYEREGFSDKFLAYLSNPQDDPHFHKPRKPLRRA